jgi:hypothetical protein
MDLTMPFDQVVVPVSGVLVDWTSHVGAYTLALRSCDKFRAMASHERHYLPYDDLVHNQSTTPMPPGEPPSISETSMELA